MLRYEATASIAAPAEGVWRRLSDVVHWDQWTPTITRIEALDGPELARGRRFLVHQPRLRPAIWTVISIEPPHSFTWEARLPGVVMLADHVVERRAQAETGVTLSFSFGGLLGPLVGRLNRRLVESYLATEAASLRRDVEKAVGNRA